jgi:hypothetical protein
MICRSVRVVRSSSSNRRLTDAAVPILPVAMAATRCVRRRKLVSLVGVATVWFGWVSMQQHLTKGASAGVFPEC